MKHISILFTALLITVSVVHAQHGINFYPDSIRIELPDQKTVAVFEMREFKKHAEFIQNFPTLLKEIADYVKKSSPDNFIETGPYHIDLKLIPAGEKEILGVGTSTSYKPIGEKTIITIRKIDLIQTQVTVKEKQIIELLPPGWELSINSKDFKVNIYSESFASLVSVGDLDFADLSAQLVKETNFKTIGKSSIRSRIVFKENKIEQSSFARKYPGDNIFLTGYAGLGLFRDKLYPQLSLALGLTFRDHFNRPNIRTSLVYDNMIFAEKISEGYQTNVNSFLSFTFDVNFNHTKTAARWTGLGAGLLVRKSGDYFSGNTAKFFILHEMENRRISVIPEFYLTDDFKKFAFGMSLRYTF